MQNLWFWKEPFKSYPTLTAEQVRIIAQKLKQIGPLVISVVEENRYYIKTLLKLLKYYRKIIFLWWYVMVGT